MNRRKLLALDQVLQRTVLVRLFLPLVAVSVIALVGAGYLGEQTLENRQRQMAQALARIVDRYLDQAARTLDAVARVAEISPAENLTFMQGTWEAYGYFDTLYYLDASHKIKQLVPPDPRYLGLDMSNLPRLVQAGDQQDPSLSRPFISLRTGNPTVYLVKPLSQGGQMVGELSLGALQEEITQGSGVSSQDTIFIMDQTGMLLAHPAFELVKQQTNRSDLEIFRRGLSGAATSVYEYAGTMVLGSAVRIDRAGWVVVDQVPLSASLGLYVWALGLTLLTACLIWLAVAWSLRRQLERHVALPLRQLSRGTGALANGDFSQGKALASLPATFAELTTLATDFQHMSDALRARQAELQASEERYRLVFENSPISLWEEDFSQVKTYFDELRASGVRDFRAYFETHPEAVAHCAHLIKVLDVNRATLALLGISDKQVLLAGLPQVLADSELKVLREEMITMAAGGQDFESSEEIHRTAAGDYRLVTVRTSVAPGYEQSLGKVLVSLVDMTDHKRAEQALRESEARLRTLIDNLPIEFWAMDDMLRFTMQNTLSLENLEPVVGKRLQDLNLPDDLKTLWIEEDLRVLEGHILRKEYQTGPADQHKTYENIVAPVRVGESIVGLVGVAIDVTARKRAEQKIRQLNQELEERVADRTAQLEAANKELEAFAYSVSHDLRAPLRHIAGFVDLLQARTAATLDDQSQHYLANIAASARRMGALIDDLLSFSRMGRHEFARQRVDLGLLAREVIQVMEPEVRDRRINWQLGDLPVVTGDAAMLRIVLVNLIDNALKFTRPHAEAEIEIGCEHGATSEAIVFVRDNGVGFDMAYADRLFGVFQRLHHPDEFEGTGIGLANVRRIIARHGGRTWAEGRVAEGAAFYFSLPQLDQAT